MVLATFYVLKAVFLLPPTPSSTVGLSLHAETHRLEQLLVFGEPTQRRVDVVATSDVMIVGLSTSTHFPSTKNNKHK